MTLDVECNWKWFLTSAYLINSWEEGHEPAEHCSTDTGNVNKRALSGGDELNQIMLWRLKSAPQMLFQVLSEFTHLFAYRHPTAQSKSQTQDFSNKGLES